MGENETEVKCFCFKTYFILFIKPDATEKDDKSDFKACNSVYWDKASHSVWVLFAEE